MKEFIQPYEQWVKRLRDTPGILGSFSGIVYRQCAPQYATGRDLLTGAGSSKHGGRWNPRAFKAVYASLSPETALAEALHPFRHYGFPEWQAMPRTLVAAQVGFTRTLDLTDPLVLTKLSIPRDLVFQELQRYWRTLQAPGGEGWTQQIGRAAFSSGVQALLVPSAAISAGKNVVWFPDNLDAASQAVLLRPEDL